MKAITLTLIISVIFLTDLICQNGYDYKTVKDSIKKYSTLLTGKWQLVGYYDKDKFIETELSSLISDSLTETKILTDTGIIKKTFRNDSLVITSRIKEIDLIELGFKKDGKGYYQHFSDYSPDSKSQTLMTCQPIPEIRCNYGQNILHFTSMTGEYDCEFKLQGDSLIIKDDKYKERRYLKYKDKNAMQQCIILLRVESLLFKVITLN